MAMLFDGLDGRVARITGSESLFGKEYDSLSDMVSFGVSPALVLYSWCCQQYGKIGWAVSFLYVAATAMRLARFNVQEQDKQFFCGLPSPAAAGGIIGLVWLAEHYHLHGVVVEYAGLLLIALCGILMVSNVPYYSFKSIDRIKKLKTNMALPILAVMFCVAVMPALVFSLVFLVYIASGLWRLLPISLRCLSRYFRCARQYYKQYANKKTTS